MLTIFRTQPKDRENRPNESEPVLMTPPVEQPVRTNSMQGPQVLPPKPPVQNPPTPEIVKTSVVGGSTTIGKDLVFEGNVQGRGSIRVEGDFRGTLEVQNEVIIGKGGTVTGDIKADVVTVEGVLKGNVEARQKISINVSGTMTGDIIAPRVVVASGAVYKGRIDMEAALKKVQNNPGDKKDNAQKAQFVEAKNVSEHPMPPKNTDMQKTIPGPPPAK